MQSLPAEVYPEYTTLEYQVPRARVVHPPAYIFVVDTSLPEDELAACRAALSQVGLEGDHGAVRLDLVQRLMRFTHITTATVIAIPHILLAIVVPQLVRGSGFGVRGLGSGVWGLGFGVQVQFGLLV